MCLAVQAGSDECVQCMTSTNVFGCTGLLNLKAFQIVKCNTCIIKCHTHIAKKRYDIAIDL